MLFADFFGFLAKNFLFSFTIVMISFVLGWLIYDRINTKNINLKDALFDKDNQAAWFEFIGAFVFPTLFLAAKAIEGSVSENIFVDLGVCVVYLLAYLIIFAVLRLMTGMVVNYIGGSDSEGKVELNKEIYQQKNTAAAMFSISLSTLFAGMIRFLEVVPSDPSDLVVSFLKMADVLSFTVIAFIVYILILSRKTTLFKEIFIDNNVAAGVSLLGFVFATQVILSGAVTLQTAFDFYELLIMSFVSLLLFGILSAIFKFIFEKLINVDIWNEVYEHNSIGAAIGQAALYIGIANIIVHFLK